MREPLCGCLLDLTVTFPRSRLPLSYLQQTSFPRGQTPFEIWRRQSPPHPEVFGYLSLGRNFVARPQTKGYATLMVHVF